MEITMEAMYAVQFAQIFAVLFGSYFLAGLVNYENFEMMINDMMKSRSHTFIIGIILMLFGLVMVQMHNVWAWNWQGLVTVFEWGMLLKGISYMVFPQVMERNAKTFMGKDTMPLILILLFVLTAVFTYFGFFAI